MIIAPVLLILFFVIAVLSGRVIGRQQNPVCAMAVGGGGLTALSICIMVALHGLEVPITTSIMLPIYIGVCSILIIANFITTRNLPWLIPAEITRIILPGMALFAIIIFPYTHFTGIDTYKWQDLATAINIEQNIPWLVHPLSLLGFTPRSYPSAQPIMLATIQIIGNLGIDAGFAVLSLLIATLGCASAYLFGLRTFKKTNTAAIYALLYIFTPVFTRYTHWATGRGLFMALYPLLLAALIGNWRPEVRGRMSRALRTMLYALCLLLIALLLALSHKVGFIIAIIAIPLYMGGFLVPKRSNRPAIIISLLPFAALALLIVSPAMLPVPFGNGIGIIRFSITRFGILMPLALLGLIAPKNLLAATRWRHLYPLMLLSIPLAFEPHMYGAMVATPMITIAATEGIIWIIGHTKFPAENRILTSAFCIIIFSFSLTTIIHRSRIATPANVYHAAQFLEKYDPSGPFVINAPGRARTQIQAYVSGCPRFNVTAATNFSIKVSPPPSIKGNPRKILQKWTAYMRGFMTVPEITTDWYGKNPRQYYVIVNNEGTHPLSATQIYNKDDIQIYLADSKQKNN